MGHCYEFGVSIDPTSELAMVVASEGGHCVCPSTGAVCHGRFAGCADIVNQPGRVPPNAPSWSRPDAAHTDQPAPSLAASAAQGAPQPVAPASTPVVTPPPVAPATVAPQPARTVAAPAAAPVQATSPMRVTTGLLEVVQQLKAELQAEATDSQRRMTDIERSIDQLSHRMTAAVPSVSAVDNSTREELAAIAESVTALTQGHSEAIADVRAQTAAVHQVVEHLAQMVVLSRQELAETAERHQSELHGVRRQVVELRASIEGRIEDSAHNRLHDQLSSIRTTVENLEPSSPADVVTASQLAQTINTLREAGAEEISAAHLVHSFQLEIRSLREQLEQLTGPARAAEVNR